MYKYLTPKQVYAARTWQNHRILVHNNTFFLQNVFFLIFI